MNGSAGYSPLKSQKPESSTWKGCPQNLKRECDDLVAGMAVSTGLTSPLALRYNMWCSINNVKAARAQGRKGIYEIRCLTPWNQCRRQKQSADGTAEVVF